MTRHEFSQNPLRIKAYREWLDSPMTQAMLQMGREECRPCGLPTQTGEQALYYAGRLDGSNLILCLWENLEQYVKSAKETERISELVTTYGTKATDNPFDA